MTDSTTTVRTVYFRCNLPHATATALNAESGRIYTQVKVEHYRIYRQTGYWLKASTAEKLNDFYNQDRPALLHSHSIDAAQQGFYKACRTAKVNRGVGAKYPHKNKMYRTTVWKKTGIRRQENSLLLSLARGYDPIEVSLPDHLRELSDNAFTEMKLVYNLASRHYEWHLVITMTVPKPKPLGTHSAAADLGEVHPATLTDGKEAVVIACRQLRAQKQHSAKNTASLQHKLSQHKKGSRRWRRIYHRKIRFLAKQKRRSRDIEHKISHEIIQWCMANKIGKLYVGDVRDVADGKRLNTKSQQKISTWSHGKLRNYINYKATAAGIEVNDNIPEYYTTQTCPQCGNRHKPRERVYTCPACGFCSHRDVVGASNILSRAKYGELGQVRPPEMVKYRHPVLRGKRSSPGHGASSSVNPV